MNWKRDLDRYLTTPPEDKDATFLEEVIDEFDPKFYQEKGDFILNEKPEEFEALIDKLFNKRKYTPAEAARIIERIYRDKNVRPVPEKKEEVPSEYWISEGLIVEIMEATGRFVLSGKEKHCFYFFDCENEEQFEVKKRQSLKELIGFLSNYHEKEGIWKGKSEIKAELKKLLGLF